MERLYAAAPFGLGLLDTQLRYVLLNQLLADINDLPISAHLGRSIEEISPTFSKAILPSIHRVLRNGQAIHDVELSPVGTHQSPAHPLFLLADLIPIATDIGEILGISISVRHLTDNQQSDCHVLGDNREPDGTRTREVATGVFGQKNAVFISRLAHELRNPLSPILSVAQILRRSKDVDGDTLSWAAETVEKQVNKLMRRINDLADVSRIVQGKLTLNRQDLELRSLLMTVIEGYRAEFTQRNFHLRVMLPESPVWIDGDSARLCRVMQTLLSNAAKFASMEGRIEVELDKIDNKAVIRVRDDGAGISDEEMNDIFDPFAQSGGTDNARKPGLGIGLALARGFVELHGGTIHAFSAGEGKGSEFLVSLPLALKPAAPSAS